MTISDEEADALLRTESEEEEYRARTSKGQSSKQEKTPGARISPKSSTEKPGKSAGDDAKDGKESELKEEDKDYTQVDMENSSETHKPPSRPKTASTRDPETVSGLTCM